MKLRQTLLVLLCMTVLLLPISLAAEGAANRFPDVRNHWGEPNITNWWRLGLVGGYPDGTFKPDNTVNRAEFISFLNRAFGYVEEAEISFTDVNPNDWFYGEVARAVNMGYISGDEAGRFQPYAPVSRIEAAGMLYAALKLGLHDIELPALDDYGDLAALTPPQIEVAKAMVAKQLMVGTQNRFNPAQTITRAETIAILDRAAGEIFNSAGVFGSDEQKIITGNASVSVPGVTLTNMLIQGDLYLTEGIGDGQVTLHNVVVLGTTILGVELATVITSGSTSLASVVPPLPGALGLNLVVVPAIGGTVTDLTDEAPYGVGSTVSLVAEAATGYDFAGWSGTGATFVDATDPATDITLTAPSATVEASFLFAHQAGISVSHSEGGAITGGAWVPHEDLHVKVMREGEVVFHAIVQPDAEGDFNIDPRSHSDISVEEQDEVSVVQGDLAVIHRVRHLTVTEFSPDANIIGGSATAGDAVRVIIFDDAAATFEDLPMLTVTTDSTGYWEADFTGVFDVSVGTYGVADIFDVHQNSTVRYWHVPATAFAVYPFEQLVVGFDWAYGAELTISKDGVVLGTAIIDDSWGYFALEQIEVSSGDVIVVTDGITTRTHEVTPLELVTIDRAAGRITGLADPNLPVTVQLVMPSQGYGPPQYADTRVITAEADGTWTVDYGQIIPADHTISVEQTDQLGNKTIVKDEP